MKKLIFIFLLFSCCATKAQEILKLDSILAMISDHHPAVRQFDAEARSLDAAASGARSWEAPELSTGLWMTPYNANLWNKQAMGTGMGQYMISAQQMLPNRRKQEAEEKYLS